MKIKADEDKNLELAYLFAPRLYIKLKEALRPAECVPKNFYDLLAASNSPGSKLP